MDLELNGEKPWNISYNKTPKDQTSTEPLYFSYSKISGAMYS